MVSGTLKGTLTHPSEFRILIKPVLPPFFGFDRF
jgi:hypothetical protein